MRTRQALPAGARRRWSRAALKHLQKTPYYRKAKTIATFIGFGSEIETERLIVDAWKHGKNVLIPVSAHGFHKPYFALFKKGDGLKKTAFGPLELLENKKPYDFKAVDLVVVPGLAFDRQRHRLGYGGGVYDRMLEKTVRAKHVGLFFRSQFIAHLPREPHDIVLDAIITEKGVQ